LTIHGPQVFLDKGEYTGKIEVYSGSMVVSYAFMGLPPLANSDGEAVTELAARQSM
jgi:hypothetical protein